MIEGRQQFAAKTEDTEGTAETLAATNAILAKKVTFDPTIDMEELDLVSSSLSPFAAVAGGRWAKMTVECPLKGSGTAGTPPEIDVLLRACGFAATTVAGTSVTYAPASSAVPCLTMAKYVDGKRYLMAGVRGTFEIALRAGKPGIIKFDFLGTGLGDSDTSLLSGISYQTTAAQPFQNASFTVDSYAAVIEALTIAAGNSFELRESANGTMGYVSAVIGKRQGTYKINPEDVLLATHDFWATWEAGSLVATTATLGATAGNILTITTPKLQYGKLGQGERALQSTTELDGLLKRSSGDDELSLAFT